MHIPCNHLFFPNNPTVTSVIYVTSATSVTSVTSVSSVIRTTNIPSIGIPLSIIIKMLPGKIFWAGGARTFS